MTTRLCKKEVKGNVVEYLFMPSKGLTPDIIEAMVLLIRSNMSGSTLCGKKEAEHAFNPLALNYENVVSIAGKDKKSLIDLSIAFIPSSGIMKLEVKSNEKVPYSISSKEMDNYWMSYCDDLENKAYTYIKIGECYQKLISAARKYVESDFDERYAEFSDDGYSIDLAYLYSPPQRER